MEAEDTTLVRRWLAIAQDPVTGNEQRAKHFSDRVHAELSAHLPKSFDDVRKTKPARIAGSFFKKQSASF